MHLVVDTNALISGVSLSGLADRFWTVDAVLGEVRDARARAVLDSLPFKLETRIPAESSVDAIKAFARKTGDIAKLSNTDILLLALAHQLEKEVNGDKFIRTEPPTVVTAAALPSGMSAPRAPLGSESTAADSGAEAERPPPACKFFRSRGGCRNGASCRFAHVGSGGGAGSSDAPVASAAAAATAAEDEDGWEVAGSPAAAAALASAVRSAAATAAAEENKHKEADGAGSGAAAPTPASSAEAASAGSTSAATSSSSAAAKRDGDASDAHAGHHHDDEHDDDDDYDDDSDEEDDGAGLWVGPGGAVAGAGAGSGSGSSGHGVVASVDGAALPFGYEIVRGAAFAPGADEEAAAGRKPVACITSDFPMQNVLLQMNLQLASVGGKLVRSVKSWVLKCDACFKITPDMSKLFCPACGNATLARLGVTLGADGAPRYHYKKTRTFNTRGTVYSLPAPKGGRDGATTDLLLREDQLLTGAWAVKVRTSRGKGAEREGLYAGRLASMPEAGGAGSAAGGAGSRGFDAMAGRLVVGYGSRNPNASKGKRR